MRGGGGEGGGGNLYLSGELSVASKKAHFCKKLTALFASPGRQLLLETSEPAGEAGERVVALL